MSDDKVSRNKLIYLQWQKYQLNGIFSSGIPSPPFVSQIPSHAICKRAVHPGHIYYRWPGYISEFTWYTLYLLDIPWFPQINPFFAIFIALMIFAIFSRLSQLLQPIALFKTKIGIMKWCHIFWIWPEKNFCEFFCEKNLLFIF